MFVYDWSSLRSACYHTSVMDIELISPELGGCNIADKGENVTYNEFSWNSVANVLFLDRELAF